jgi:hypothetical protein
VIPPEDEGTLAELGRRQQEEAERGVGVHACEESLGKECVGAKRDIVSLQGFSSPARPIQNSLHATARWSHRLFPAWSVTPQHRQ